VCKVKEVKEISIIVEVLNTAEIGEKKNMALPGAVIDMPTITEKDEDDLVNFGLKYNVDMIFLSFTRYASCIE